MNLHALASALETLQQVIASFAVHALWQVPLLAGAAWVAIRIGRPHVRTAHTLWCVTLLLCVLLPVGATWGALSVALQANREHATVSLDALTEMGQFPALQRESRWVRFLHHHASVKHGLQPVGLTLQPEWVHIAARSYLLLTIFFAIRLMVSWRRMRRIVEHASPVAVPDAVLDQLRLRCAQLHIAVPACRLSDQIPGPAVAGVMRPSLFLPRSFHDLKTEEIDAILAHELAHVRRRDLLLNAACTWLLLPLSFHPAAFWMARRIRQTREMACDAEAAITLGSPETYAEALLQIAGRAAATIPSRWEALRFFNTGLLGIGLELFNREGTMEERMRMLMDGNGRVVRGHAVRVVGCLTVAASATLAAGMLQVQPALASEQVTQPNAHAAQSVPATSLEQQTPSPKASAASPRLLSNEHAREQLRHAQRQLADAQQKATSDEARDTIATAREAMTAAEQALAAVDVSGKMGFYIAIPDTTKLEGLDSANVDLPTQAELNAMSAKQQVAIKKLQHQFSSPEFKAEMDRAMKLKAQTFTTEQKKMLDDLQTGEMQMRLREEARQLAHLNLPGMPFTAPADGQPLKIAASVLASNSLHKENPVYPVEAKQKAIQGAVVLHVIVSETGTVEQIATLQSPDEALTRSAITAVQQWTYKPFLLNGTAVPVESTVTVTYSLAK